MALSTRHPKLNVLLICERVIRDAETGATSLIGIVDTVVAPRLPLTLPSLLAFAKLTDAEGAYDFTLEIVRRDDDETVAVAPPANLAAEDPLAPTKLVIAVANVTFTRAGHYDFRLWANGRFVDSTAVLVREVESPEGGSELHGRA